MATSRLARNVTEDYLTCTICLQRFREPRTLPCEHTFCLACLASHIGASPDDNVFLCPVDKTELQTNKAEDPWERARAFPTDVLAEALIRVVEEDMKQANVSEKGEGLDFFCFGCQTMTSADDAVQNHRSSSCDCVKLQKAYQRVMPVLVNYNRELEKVYLKSEKIRRIFTTGSGISEAKQEVLGEIDEFEARLDDFYAVCKTDLGALKTQVAEHKVECDTKNNCVLHDEIARRYSKFNQNFDDENIPELLSLYRSVDKNLKELGKFEESLQTKTRKFPLDFLPNKQILNMLHSKQRCGHLKLTSASHFRGQQTTDVDECNYYDVVMTDKYIVTCDGESGYIQRFLHDGTYVDSMKVDNICRMTAVKDDEIAATRLFKRKIAYISLGKKMHIRDQIRTKKSYIGICLLSTGNFCVSFYDGEEPPGIEIISDDGKVLKTILGHRNPTGSIPLFLVPMFLTSTANDNIIVCDFTDSNHVICFNDNLDLRWYQSFPSMPCCVTSDDDDTLYVSFPDVNEVVTVYEEDGKKMRTVVKKSDDVIRPYAITVNDNTLVITEDETDKIHLVKL
ncbi:tripartite motif-containing protein 2-like [Ostrea edulis]|uniref:tripartite motif-containing protein 2-like n=1 Tax=Ostrea edulis TaxID=37623 RepID=UPI0024AFAE47|nr:tripartite motif-containing protein 2-like [Ostrea edulis]XP_055995833.1 tripartite motif-containing protein 2-like [Ostrea edulis]